LSPCGRRIELHRNARPLGVSIPIFRLSEGLDLSEGGPRQCDCFGWRRLGRIIAKRNCHIYLATDTGCEDAKTYTLLLNANRAALAVRSTCRGMSSPSEKQRFVFFLDDFQTVLAIMMKEHAVGFAIPISGNQFKVARFSLEGSNEAIAGLGSLLDEGKSKSVVNSEEVLQHLHGQLRIDSSARC
jgi:hypothetical protein